MSIVQKLALFIKKRLRSERFKVATQQSLPFWIASVATGFIAVMYTEIFRWIEVLHDHIQFRSNLWVFVFVPVVFVASWYLIMRFAPTASGSGIPQLFAAIKMSGKKGVSKFINKLLSVKVIFVKIISSSIILLGGGAIGREGPTIQIAGAVFNSINKLIPKDWPKINNKLMLVSGGAAGLAAAFNTPLGGIVFAIEELGKTHLNKFRTPLFVAVIIAGLTSQVFLGSYLYLGTPNVPRMGYWGLLYVILAALFAGYSGYLFSAIILRVVKWKKRLNTKRKLFVWVLFCAFLFALLLFYVGNDAAGSGKPLIGELLFNEKRSVEWYTFPSRYFGTIVTYLSGAAGGIFSPSLSIGAALGDTVVNLLDIEDYKNLIILTAMIGFLTGVTHSPFTSFILVLEMTDRHTSVFPMMLAALIAYAVSHSLNQRSFYEELSDIYVSKETLVVKNNRVA